MILRPAAVVGLAAMLALAPAAGAWAQEESATPGGPTASPEPSEPPLIPLPQPTEEEEPPPSAAPATEEPEPSPTPEPTRAPRPRPTPTPEADTQVDPAPAATDVTTPVSPSPPRPSPLPVEEPSPAAVPDQPGDPVDRLVRWALILAGLLGIAGGAGLYWTREHS